MNHEPTDAAPVAGDSRTDARPGRALAGQVAIVTGGASGIGAATVARFVAEGAQVLVADLDAEKGAAVAAAQGDRAAFLAVDVSKESDVAAMITEAQDRFGGLDVLFNNAGFGGALGPIAETSVEDYDLTFDVLLKSVFLGIKYAAPVLMGQRSGSIINTASIAGLRAGWSPHLYAVAKAAVLQLTHSVALELASAEVRCNAICPGFIATPLAFGRPDADEAQLARLRDEGAHGQPLGRVGEPSDIAAMALFLASAESSWITGQEFVVDGGLSAGPPWSQFPPPFRTHRPIRHHRPPDR
jgi:NAD(P)-dependent dehydrogenase (short-subunit alcohol dehydrogenase family)